VGRGSVELACSEGHAQAIDDTRAVATFVGVVLRLTGAHRHAGDGGNCVRARRALGYQWHGLRRRQGDLTGCHRYRHQSRHGSERVVTSSSDGRFTIPTLVPGIYSIKAELPGFQLTTLAGLVLNVGQELTINVTMQVAGVTESLVVTGQSPIVETTSSRIGTNVTSSEIDGLPSVNRSQFSLMQTIPGLVPVCKSGRSKAASRRQRSSDHQQPVPRRRTERQRLAPRRVARYPGPRFTRLNV
jgi:carboxypeptidase family protein